MTEPFAEVLKQEEGFRPHMYRCSEGVWTVGYGLRIDPSGPGISREAAECDLEIRLQAVMEDLIEIYNPGWWFLADARQAALISMRYQLGSAGYRQFKRHIAAVRREDWDDAARESLDSRAAHQTPERYERIADALRTGESQWGCLS